MTTGPDTSKPSTVPPSLLNLPEGLTPDSIDILPVLYTILSRLQNPQTTPSSNSQSSSLQPPSTSPPQASTPSQSQSQSHITDSNSTTPLTIKDIHAATDEIKHKLQKARAMVKRLPDMERGFEEQEEEIRELEERIREQREVLRGLAEMGRRKGDVEMEG